MKTIVTPGISGGFFVAARGSISVFLLLPVAKKVSQEVALALFKEALKAGWFSVHRQKALEHRERSSVKVGLFPMEQQACVESG